MAKKKPEREEPAGSDAPAPSGPRSVLGEAALVALMTGVIYLDAFLFKSAYASWYGIPWSSVELDIPDLLIAAVLVLPVAGVFVWAADRAPGGSLRMSVAIRAGLIAVFFATVYAFNRAGISLEWEFYVFPPVLIGLQWWSRVAVDRLNQGKSPAGRTRAARADTPANSLIAYVRRAVPTFWVIVAQVLFLGVLAWGGGRLMGTARTDFFVTTDKTPEVQVLSSGDNAVMIPRPKPGLDRLTPQFKIRPSDELGAVRLEHIGRVPGRAAWAQYWSSTEASASAATR